MRRNVQLERELYPEMCQWLKDYLEDNYRGAEIIVRDTSLIKLDTVLDQIGVLDQYPDIIGIGMQIDVLGIVKKKEKASLFFIEAKKTFLTTHDLGQILIYSRICNPEKAFLFSSAGTGSIDKLIREREDIAIYSTEKRLKMIQVAKWDITRKAPDLATMHPKLI